MRDRLYALSNYAAVDGLYLKQLVGEGWAYLGDGTGTLPNWQPTTDFSALSPDDEVVDLEVSRRLATGDLSVAVRSPVRLHGHVPDVEMAIDPLRLQARLGRTPSPNEIHQELARQVRLSEMARRNNLAYCAVDQAGGTLYSRRQIPLAGSVISNHVVPINRPGALTQVGDCFRSADQVWPAEWGNLTLLKRAASPDGQWPGYEASQSVFAGQYLVLVLPRSLPPVLMISKERLPSYLLNAGRRPFLFEDRFDECFATYGLQRDVLQVITEPVRLALIEEAADWHVELLGTNLIFFRSGQADWSRPETWRELDRLRDLAIEVYEQMGEYVDPVDAIADGPVYSVDSVDSTDSVDGTARGLVDSADGPARGLVGIGNDGNAGDVAHPRFLQKKPPSDPRLRPTATHPVVVILSILIALPIAWLWYSPDSIGFETFMMILLVSTVVAVISLVILIIVYPHISKTRKQRRELR